MTDLLKEDVESHLQWKRDVRSNEDYHNPDGGKYEWCLKCVEQICKCEEIRISNERIAAWGKFNNALWTDEDIEGARKIVEDMGFSQEEIEDSIERIANWKLCDETDKRTEWIRG